MGKHSRRGDTKAQRYESYRIEAAEYVSNRDDKIAEIVADICRKHPRLPEAEARRIVTEHWAIMERDNDVPNMVRSKYLGYDERGLIDRVQARLRDRLRSSLPDSLPSTLADRLTGSLSTADSVESGRFVADRVSEAVRQIAAASGQSEDYVQAAIDDVMRNVPAAIDHARRTIRSGW